MLTFPECDVCTGTSYDVHWYEGPDTWLCDACLEEWIEWERWAHEVEEVA